MNNFNEVLDAPAHVKGTVSGTCVGEGHCDGDRLLLRIEKKASSSLMAGL
jgi:hypothetical protein